MAKTRDQTATWARMRGALKRENMKSYALVAIDESGYVHWGSDFKYEPETLLRYLRTIEADIRQHNKRLAAA